MDNRIPLLPREKVDTQHELPQPPLAQITNHPNTLMADTSIRNSIKAAGGEIVRLDPILWTISPVLRRQSRKGDSYLVLDFPESSVLAMLRAYRMSAFPADFPTKLNVLAVADSLKLDKLAHLCFRSMSMFTEIDYPSECSRKAVMVFFKMLVDSPLRTSFYYSQQLRRIGIHCNMNRDVLTNALHPVRNQIERFKDLNLEPIPCSFQEHRLPIAILKRAGKLFTVVFRDGQWCPVEIFGKHFNLENNNVENYFYLKYGSYLLYKSGDCVFCKNLRADTHPKLHLSGCTYFLSRGNFVFAVVKKDDRFLVHEWIDARKEFASIYSTNLVIDSVEFDCRDSERILAINFKPFIIRTYTLEGKGLAERAEKYSGDFTSVQLVRGEIHFFSEDSAKTALYVRSYDPQSQWGARLNLGLGRGTPLMSGDLSFVLNDQGLNILRREPNKHVLTMLRDEFRALSELWLSV